MVGPVPDPAYYPHGCEGSRESDLDPRQPLQKGASLTGRPWGTSQHTRSDRGEIALCLLRCDVPSHQDQSGVR